MDSSSSKSSSRGLYGYIARRYLSSSRGRGFLSLITWIAIGGVAVGDHRIVFTPSGLTISARTTPAE